MAIRRFALILGVVYLLVGLLGLIPAALQPPPPEGPPMRLTAGYGYLLGLFPVNLAHTVVHLAIGLWGVLAYRRFSSAQRFAQLVALLYGALALIGLIPGLDTLFGWLPLHAHDVWLHALTALVAAYFGWFVRPQDVRPTPIG